MSDLRDPASGHMRLRLAEIVWVASAIVSAAILIDMGERAWALAACAAAAGGPLVARSAERRYLHAQSAEARAYARRMSLPVGLGQLGFLTVVAYLAVTLGASGL